MTSDDKILRHADSPTELRCIPGPPRRHTLVFIHGLLGDSHQWDVFDEHSSPREYAGCYLLDYHFERRRAASITFDKLAQETMELLLAAPGLTDQRMTFIGSSFGGHMALHLAANTELRPHNLVLFSPGGIDEVAKRRGMFQSYRNVGKILDVSFERIFNDETLQQNQILSETIRRYQERIRASKFVFTRNVIDLIRSMKSAALSGEEMGRIRARTLLIWGEHDMVVPPEIGRIMAEQIPNSRLELLPSGHASHVQCPREASALLKDFCVGRLHARPRPAAAKLPTRSAFRPAFAQ